MFTSIEAAIEEARFLRTETKHHHCVTQKPNGTMHVRQVTGNAKERILRKMYCTRSDHWVRSTVNTEVRV